MKNPLQPIFDYFRSSKAELEKVTWPSKQDTIRYTVIVIVSCLVAAVFFGALDFGLSHGVQAIVAKRAPATTPAAQNEPPVAPIVTATDASGTPTTVQVNEVPVNGTTTQTVKVTN